MALPRPEVDWSEPAGPAVPVTDWESLRHDLEALLHQVENRHLGAGHSPADSPDARHRAALKSVQRAVERFSGPRRDFAPAPRRHELASAIDEIRARAGGPAPQGRAFPGGYRMPEEFAEDLRAEHAHAARHPLRPRPRLDVLQAAPPLHEERGEAISGLKQMTAAVSGMAGRLERLEADMRATRDAAGDMVDIATQVSQLTHVVELIAGAVGEQGQVKRLETQIAELARLYSDGPKPEIAALTRRIDELGTTVDRLAELQVREMGRLVRDTDGAAAQHSDAMRTIEDGVRSIYDRIDALESSYAVSPDDLDRLTREMAGVTAALRRSGDGDALAGIVQRLDGLTRQIDDMGPAGDTSVTALRDDVEALRDAVREAVAPRFAAIEKTLESLTNRVGGGMAPSAPSFTQIEEQIRKLAQRLDQTGQQLNGLTELYKSDSGRGAPADYEALAAMVAERTSQEVARLRGDETGLDETSLGALESRLSKLFSSSRPGEAPGLLSSVAENLTRVDERLNRLENALAALAQGEAAFIRPQPAAKPAVPAPQPQKPAGSAAAPAVGPPRPDTAPEPPTMSRPSLSEPLGTSRGKRTPQQPDAMPRPPARERPLLDDELSALATPVEDWSSLNLDDGGQHKSPAPPPSSPPGFDVSKIERPARPKSSFADESPGFTPLDESGIAPAGELSEESESPASDRNTFIAAARRAARGNLEAQQGSGASQSLIGKALARFQSSRTENASAASKHKPVRGGRPDRKAPNRHAEAAISMARAADGDEYGVAEGRATPDDFAADAVDRPNPDLAAPTGFLARHRRPLMLAGALAATVLLAANLVVQRLTPDAAPDGTSSIESPVESALIDPTPTGSIDPIIEMNLTEPSPTRQVLPSTLTTEPLSGTPKLDTTFTHSVPPVGPEPIEAVPAPIKLEPPPEKLGPVELRQAAADGDPRSQFEVGAIYTEGSVVDQDFEAAAAWYERAAAQGFAPAQYRLGNLYEHGNGVDQDLEQARLWYSRAAEAGNRLAMHNLAALYAGGALGEQQFAAAAEWFERASEAGMTDSQFNLGMLYARGLGVTQDLKASYKWFSLAAEAGDKDAAKARDDIGKSLDAASLNQIRADIESWHMTPINIPANFAPIGTWSDGFDPGQTITDKAVTEGVQRALARLGYDPGTIDGVMGPKTTQAITEFERATGMRPTGLVNPRLLAVLGSQPV